MRKNFRYNVAWNPLSSLEQLTFQTSFDPDADLSRPGDAGSLKGVGETCAAARPGAAAAAVRKLLAPRSVCKSK